VVQSVTSGAAAPAAAAAAPALLLLPSTRKTQTPTQTPTGHVQQAVKQQLCWGPLLTLPLPLLLLMWSRQQLLLLLHRCWQRWRA
jgi:hypothetical protein